MGLGQKLISRNFRTRFGEIDLITEDAGCVCFVEVRARKQGGLVSGLETVTASKQDKLAKAALQWLSENNPDASCRFDVVEVELSGGTGRVSQYIRDAFQPEI